MIGIVAHTARAEHAHTLMDQVGAAYTSVDNGTLGCNGNHKQVWTWLNNHTDDWAIVLEDDSLPTPDFVHQATQALAVAPSPLVSFYLGKHHIPTLDIEHHKEQAITKAQSADAHWITSRQLLHAVAVAIDKDHIAAMLAHIADLPEQFPIDEAITHWATTNTIDVCYTWPSLVDHADQPTLFRHLDKLPRPPGRVAYNTGGHDTWTDRAVIM